MKLWKLLSLLAALAGMGAGLGIWVHPGAGLFAVATAVWLDLLIGSIVSWQKR